VQAGTTNSLHRSN